MDGSAGASRRTERPHARADLPRESREKLLDVTIRRATPADAEAIGAIYNEAVLSTTATYDYEPRSPEAQKQWFDEHERTGFPVFVAERTGGPVVGWSHLTPYRERPGYRFTGEDSVYVAAGERGQGLGKLLLPPVIAAAQEMGLRAIMAVIDASNEVSIRLHAGFGFEEVGRLKHVGFKFERWLDVILMEKLLF